MKEDQQSTGVDALLIDVDADKNNLGTGDRPPQPAGFIGFPQPPILPQQHSDFQPFSYPVSSVFYLASFLSRYLTCGSCYWTSHIYYCSV
jgi:hypothetical protein